MAQEQHTGPVFIVGMNGSGTTLLRDLLNNHPAFYAFPKETKLLPYFIDAIAAGKFGDLRVDGNFRRLWETLCNDPRFQLGRGEWAPLPENWRTLPHDLATVVEHTMRFFAAREGKSRWGEKTPNHVLHMEKLAALFPEARFVHLIRDGRGCAASLHRRWGYHPQRTLVRWKTAIAEGRAQGERLGERYLEVRYEALAADPDTWMRRICTYLGLPFTNEVLTVKRRHRPVVAQEKTVVAAGASRWQSYFSVRQQRRMEAMAGGTLAALGYPVNTASDSEPGAWSRAWWEVSDYARRGLALLRGNRRTDDQGALGVRWNEVQTAVRTWKHKRA